MIKLVVFIMFVLVGIFVFLPIYAAIKNWFRAVRYRLLGSLTNTAKKPQNGAIWQGMTTGQLKMAVGTPDQIEIKTGDTKGRQIYRYFPGKTGGFDLKVMVENGAVVAWFYK